MSKVIKASEVELPDLVQEALKKLSKKELEKMAHCVGFDSRKVYHRKGFAYFKSLTEITSTQAEQTARYGRELRKKDMPRVAETISITGLIKKDTTFCHGMSRFISTRKTREGTR